MDEGIERAEGQGGQVWGYVVAVPNVRPIFFMGGGGKSFAPLTPKGTPDSKLLRFESPEAAEASARKLAVPGLAPTLRRPNEGGPVAWLIKLPPEKMEASLASLSRADGFGEALSADPAPSAGIGPLAWTMVEALEENAKIEGACAPGRKPSFPGL